MKKFDPDKIPIWLRRTPDQQAQDLAYQDTLRQAQGPGRRPNRMEAQLLRANAVKLSTIAQLEGLRHDPEADPKYIEAAEAQLAEALAMEGNYSDAAALHPKAEYADRFRAIAEAIDRDDDSPRCECEVKQETDPNTGQAITITTEIVDEMVFSPKHGKMMPLVRCVKCGAMNVKAASSHLTQRMEKVQEAHRSAKESRQ